MYRRGGIGTCPTSGALQGRRGAQLDLRKTEIMHITYLKSESTFHSQWKEKANKLPQKRIKIQFFRLWRLLALAPQVTILIQVQ